MNKELLVKSIVKKPLIIFLLIALCSLLFACNNPYMQNDLEPLLKARNPEEPKTEDPVIINNVAIVIKSPVRDAVPAASAILSEEGGSSFVIESVSWMPQDNPFKGGVTYTVSITLKANEGFIFTDQTTAAVNGNNALITVGYGGSAAMVSYEFAPTDTRIITGLEIETGPRLNYIHGENLDLSELTVKLIFNDNTSEYIDFSDFVYRNISANYNNNITLSRSMHNGQEIIVSLGEFNSIAGILDIERAAGAAVGKPQLPEVFTTNGFTIEAVAEPANGQSVEYAVSANSSAAPSDLNWQEELTFTALNTMTTYYVYARSAQDQNYFAGIPNISEAITFYVISFSINEGTGTTPDALAVIQGGSITLPVFAGFYRPGFVFIGWNTANDGTETNYAAGGLFTANTGNTLLHANWQPTIRVVIGIQIDTFPALDYIHGENLDLSGLVAKFVYDDDTTENVIFADFALRNISINQTDGITLSRTIHNTQVITVSYESFNANAGVLNISRAPGAAVGFPALPAVITTIGFTIEAVDAPANGQSVEYAVSVSSAAEPSGLTWQPGLTFSPLSTSTTYYVYARSAQDENFSAGAPGVSDSITFFVVSFNLNGGTGTSPDIQAALLGTTITLPDSTGLSNDGFSFDGWNTAADGTGTAYAGGVLFVVNADTPLFAQWETMPFSQDFAFNIPAFADNAPVISGLTLSRSNSGGNLSAGTLTVTNFGDFTSIQWWFGAALLNNPATEEYQSSLTLDVTGTNNTSTYNILGTQRITVEVTTLSGGFYSREITFQVVP